MKVTPCYDIVVLTHTCISLSLFLLWHCLWQTGLSGFQRFKIPHCGSLKKLSCKNSDYSSLDEWANIKAEFVNSVFDIKINKILTSGCNIISDIVKKSGPFDIETVPDLKSHMCIQDK